MNYPEISVKRQIDRGKDHPGQERPEGGWEWAVNATPRPLYPRERPGTLCLGGWVGPRAGLDGCGKSHPRRNSIQDRPARGELLYRLS
jgi:hypothetical protein